MDNKTLPRIATGGITEEMRKMELGEILWFPMETYNYNSIRTTPCASLITDRLTEGKEWKVKIDRTNKCTVVTRIA